MNREQAARLVEEYFGSWMNQDLERFLSTLSDDVVIVECDGTAYRGVDQARRWFTDWHADPVNGRATDWEILRILFDVPNSVATVEWDFRCVCHDEASSFLGASVVTLGETTAVRIHEYRMDKDPVPPPARAKRSTAGLFRLEDGRVTEAGDRQKEHGCPTRRRRRCCGATCTSLRTKP